MPPSPASPPWWRAGATDVWRPSSRGEEVGTLFVPSRSRMQSRKRWLAFASLPRGGIMVDAGAKEALVPRRKELAALRCPADADRPSVRATW